MESHAQRGATVDRLIGTIQDLSQVRQLGDVQRIVRSAARSLTGADGATFVLRDGERCHYADEDAIAPLWKGKRFPLEACISGWAMLNRQTATIEDIYADERIPHEAYRPTFVKSLAMVPIRSSDPVGAIGNYWAERHAPTADEVALLQSLADATSVAMENVRVRALSQTDELTGVNNRRGFFEVATEAFEAERAVEGEVAIAFVDVDGLKRVNASLGHETGSELIATVASALASCAREGDVVGRLGGDEFALLRPTGAASADDLRAEIADALAKGAEVRSYPVAATIGVALERAHVAPSLDALIDAADRDMYAHRRAAYGGPSVRVSE